MNGQNNLFRGSSPSWANACVGNNGSPSYVEYAKGFSAAANLLIEKTLENRSIDYSVDEFVYPICFNMRHSVELRLKGTVLCLKELSQHRKRLPDFNLESSHDLGRIWDYIKRHAPDLDQRYQHFIDRLDDFVTDLSEVDPTGQTFRYPTNRESAKHLTEVSVISVSVLREAFSKAEVCLDELNLFNDYICLEYSYGTFTKKLSRHQIYLLAKELPPRDSWSDDSFKSVKDRAKQYFSLSSNAFSEAIRKIENHFEMGILIEKAPILADLHLSHVETFFDSWFLVHDISEVRNPITEPKIHDLSSSDIIQDILDNGDKTNKAVDAISSGLTPEAIGELRALFYFGEHLDYSEYYLRLSAQEKSELKMVKDREPSQYLELICSLVDKRNALRNIVKSLVFLNQSTIAHHVINRYELPDTLDWLQRAKNREPFSQLSILGYGSWADVDTWLTQAE